MARGEEVGAEEPDPTEEPEVGCLGLLKFIVYAIVFVLLAGKFFTGSYLWEHELPNIKKLIPVRLRPRDCAWLSQLIGVVLQTNQRLYSERMLATFDGTDAERPVYLAVRLTMCIFRCADHGPCCEQIDGDVYDVSAGRRTYGPGGPYHMLYVLQLSSRTLVQTFLSAPEKTLPGRTAPAASARI